MSPDGTSPVVVSEDYFTRFNTVNITVADSVVENGILQSPFSIEGVR